MGLLYHADGFASLSDAGETGKTLGRSPFY